MSIYGKFVSALLAIVIAGFGMAYVAGLTDEVMADVSDIAQETACYILKAHEGGIALFKEGEAEPVAVYSAPMEDINPTDAKLLEEGIRLYGMSDVARLIEDLDLQ
ncbi:MAG: hypothetical protein IJZ47_01045 [Oscillospiraceae bacterium]|nr:hypothetical protein [Oscillospiraceae bacterium]